VKKIKAKTVIYERVIVVQ